MDRNTPIVSQEEPLLTSEEAWQDYQSLKTALAEAAGDSDAQQWLELPPHISALVQELVDAGVCRDECDVIARAVEAFFVAVSPQQTARYRILQEARAKYR